MSEDASSWSATDTAIHDTLRSCLDTGRVAAVATIVDVEGSAYRRPGAKMVIPADGEQMGAITAGCLEGPVADIAATVRSSGEPEVATFDLTDDDGWGMGLGCNGVVTVLVEPVDASLEPALAALSRADPVTVVTHLEAPVGGRAVLTDTTTTNGVGDRPPLPDEVLDAVQDRAASFRADGHAGTVTVETGSGDVDVFVDGIRPPPRLVIVGNQADVNAVAELGAMTGFRVTVATTRGNIDATRFPSTATVESVRAPDVDSIVEAPEETYAVVMTHNFVDDRLAVEALLDAGLPYVGLMGPRDRFEEMHAEWEPGDVPDLDRLSTPVGLDLGGGSPTEIALAIVAEVVAEYHGRDGGRLGDRDTPIHPRISESGE